MIKITRSSLTQGSFNVSMSRVCEGRKLYLKSFDPSYIQVNPRIEEKLDAMHTHSRCTFKKIYLKNELFKNCDKEVKLAYLNINGLLHGNHAKYLDADRNLFCIDIFAIAETKLQ